MVGDGSDSTTAALFALLSLESTLPPWEAAGAQNALNSSPHPFFS